MEQEVWRRVGKFDYFGEVAMTLPAKAAEPNSENLRFLKEQNRAVLSFLVAQHVVLLFGFLERLAPSADPKMSTGSSFGSGSIYSCTVTRAFREAGESRRYRVGVCRMTKGRYDQHC